MNNICPNCGYHQNGELTEDGRCPSCNAKQEGISAPPPNETQTVQEVAPVAAVESPAPSWAGMSAVNVGLTGTEHHAE
jgi:uncharacterized Zn finger protein (UPF0148 family)